MVECPQCGTPNAFRRKRRSTGAGVEIYVSCRSCPYEMVVLHGPLERVTLQLDVEDLRGKVASGQEILRPILRTREERLERMLLAEELAAG